MTSDKRESAEWALGADAEAERLKAGVEKALADGAARGFPTPPGDTLEAILGVSLAAKVKLVSVNGKIYGGRREVLFQVQEFALNVRVKLAKLVMELYREQIFDALSIEQSQVEALRETTRADVERMNAETELRMRAITQNRAEAERRILVYKRQLVEAETTTMTAETILIQAQLATAEKKLEIIASIYQVLAAEELVVAAEERRAASLTKVLAAELIVAGIKEEMVPFYLEKAEAREALAQAIIQEIPITEALVRLGYDRIDLKTTEEYVGHLEREGQEELELDRLAFIRANLAAELAKIQAKRLLQEYHNLIQEQIIGQRKFLQMDEVTFQLATRLAREAIGVNNETELLGHDVANLTRELISVLANMDSRAQDKAGTVKDGAILLHTDDTTSLLSTRYLAGVI